MMPIRPELAAEQREALWKWRWLGWKRSTPAFKVSLGLLGGLSVALLVYALRG